MKSKKKDGSDYNEVVINQIKIKNVYLVKDMYHEDDVPFAIEDINDWWRGKVQLKTEKQLISLINKKKK
jgi:hydroxypyruvate isomerase